MWPLSHRPPSHPHPPLQYPQRLLFNAATLDDANTLSHYGISREATLTLLEVVEEKADDGSGGGIPLEVEIVLGAHTGMNIQCDGSNHAKCNNANTGAYEKIKIKQRGSSYIITSMKTGNNLQCHPDGRCVFANRNEGQWEKWSVESRGDALFFVSQHTGNVMQCAGDGTVRCANQNRMAHETFRIVWRGGGGGGGPRPQGRGGGNLTEWASATGERRRRWQEMGGDVRAAQRLWDMHTANERAEFQRAGFCLSEAQHQQHQQPYQGDMVMAGVAGVVGGGIGYNPGSGFGNTAAVVVEREQQRDWMGDERTIVAERDGFGNSVVVEEQRDWMGDERRVVQERDAFGDSRTVVQERDAWGDSSTEVVQRDMFGNETDTTDTRDAFGNETITRVETDAFGDVEVERVETDAFGDVTVERVETDAFGDVTVEREEYDEGW